MNKALTEEEFDNLTKDLPEDGFKTLVPLLMESFSKKRGRTLDTTQVASLTVGLMEMGATIDAQISTIGILQKELEECHQKNQEQPKSRLWSPR